MLVGVGVSDCVGVCVGVCVGECVRVDECVELLRVRREEIEGGSVHQEGEWFECRFWNYILQLTN